LRRAIALLLAFAAGSAAVAQSPRILWRCMYLPGEAPAIACMLATAAPGAIADDGGRHLPGLVARIRSDPESLDGETIVIPLHAIPIDAAFSERLARSVMCGGNRPGCGVEFVPRFDPVR
jgi:hypothetical protein